MRCGRDYRRKGRDRDRSVPTAAVCGMGLLNLDQEAAFGSGEASSVLAAGAQEKPRICANQDHDQVRRFTYSSRTSV